MSLLWLLSHGDQAGLENETILLPSQSLFQNEGFSYRNRNRWPLLRRRSVQMLVRQDTEIWHAPTST